jgi:hypothetical protein
LVFIAGGLIIFFALSLFYGWLLSLFLFYRFLFGCLSLFALLFFRFIAFLWLAFIAFLCYRGGGGLGAGPGVLPTSNAAQQRRQADCLPLRFTTTACQPRFW